MAFLLKYKRKYPLGKRRYYKKKRRYRQRKVNIPRLRNNYGFGLPRVLKTK